MFGQEGRRESMLEVKFVKTRQDLSNIPPADKYEGMVVQVVSDGSFWELKNSSWYPLGGCDVDVDAIETSIRFLDQGKLDSVEFYRHNHNEEYSDINHTHGGYISKEDLSSHVADANPEALHLTEYEKSLITKEKIASKKERGMVIVGSSLHVNADGVINTAPDVYNVWENVYQIGKENENQYQFWVEEDRPYIEGTLQVYVNGQFIPKTGIRNGGRDPETGYIKYFYLEEGSLNIGDTVVARYYAQPTMQFREIGYAGGIPARHSESHMPGGDDYIPFVSLTNKGGLMSSAQLELLNGKLSAAEVATTPTANKLLKLDKDAELIANSKGNAATATKLKTAVEINGVLFDGTQDISIGASTHVGEEPPEIVLANSVWIHITGEESANE